MTPVIVDAENLLRRGIMASIREDAKTQSYTSGLYSAFTTMSTILRTDVRHGGPILMAFDYLGRGIKYGAGIHPERLKLLPGYKENRGEKPSLVEEYEYDAAMEQVDHAVDMFQWLGVPCVRYPYREADDIIGAATKLWLDRGTKPVVVSGDHDMLQTVAWGASVFMLNRKVLVTRDNFEDEIGVPAELFLLYKALLGDTSDEIKGVKGVGEKTAKQLVLDWFFDTEDDEIDRIMHNPSKQVRSFCKWAAQDTRLKVRKACANARGRLLKVIKGIDISWSFDNVDQLREAIDHPPEEDLKKFAGVARQMGMMSLMNKAQTTYHPILNAGRAVHAKKYA